MEMLQVALGPVVLIAITLLSFVDSLVFRTASYGESHANQFFEIHEGQLHLCLIPVESVRLCFYTSENYDQK